MPSVEQHVKTGRWLPFGLSDKYFDCSECSAISERLYASYYCSSCGAKMENPKTPYNAEEAEQASANGDKYVNDKNTTISDFENRIMRADEEYGTVELQKYEAVEILELLKEPYKPSTSGHWVNDEQCSECDCDAPSFLSGSKWEMHQTRYCPNCGAFMDNYKTHFEEEE